MLNFYLSETSLLTSLGTKKLASYNSNQVESFYDSDLTFIKYNINT